MKLGRAWSSGKSVWSEEVAAGGRFRFGGNWHRFVGGVGPEKIRAAEEALKWWFPKGDLRGLSFLDAGSGSGLSSLAADRLGAVRVHSFDFDPESVTSTSALRGRFAPNATSWTVEQGSLLDESYLRSLGQWDVVYSWGVAHHTGSMWAALAGLAEVVRIGGRLLVAIYNDQGRRSRLWWRVKWLYNAGRFGRISVVTLGVPILAAGGAVHDLLRRRNPLERYRVQDRGMAAVSDWVDWLGGFPFEFATPGAVIDFFEKRGLRVERQRLVGRRLGCNEFLFRK